MASTFPSVLTTYTNPAASNPLNAPSHSGIETNQNSGLGALEAFVGTLSSVQGTLMYDIRAAASNGGGHVQAANKGGTGQTGYSKGDVLVATSSSVIAKLTVGANNTVLTADSTQSAGVKWAAGPQVPVVRAYTSSSVFTYVKPSVLSYLRVRIAGAGGGRGGGTFGGAGGGGGYSEKIIVASSVASSTTIVVGTVGPVSSVGGTSAFASIMTAAGGGAGSSDPGSGSFTTSGGGGAAAGGDVNMTGNQAARQTRTANINIPGASPSLGSAGRGAEGSTQGSDNGTDGAVIIEEF